MNARLTKKKQVKLNEEEQSVMFNAGKYDASRRTTRKAKGNLASKPPISGIPSSEIGSTTMDNMLPQNSGRDQRGRTIDVRSKKYTAGTLDNIDSG